MSIIHLLSSGKENSSGMISNRGDKWLPEFLQILHQKQPELTGFPFWEQDHEYSAEQLTTFLAHWEDYYRNFVESNFAFAFRSPEMTDASTFNPLTNKHFRKLDPKARFDVIFQEAKETGTLFLYVARPLSKNELLALKAIHDQKIPIGHPIPVNYYPDSHTLHGLLENNLIARNGGTLVRTHKSRWYFHFSNLELRETLL